MVGHAHGRNYLRLHQEWSYAYSETNKRLLRDEKDIPGVTEKVSDAAKEDIHPREVINLTVFTLLNIAVAVLPIQPTPSAYLFQMRPQGHQDDA